MEDEITVENLSASIVEMVEISRLNLSRRSDVVPFILQVISENIDHSLLQPRILSIGPYHRDAVNLKLSRANKWLILVSLLDEFPKVSLQGCIKQITSLEKKARGCYGVVNLSRDEFIKMLLLDSFFILCFLMSYFMNDGLPPSEGVMNAIFSDILLIENQIPFFIIEALWDIFAVSAEGVLKETNLMTLLKLTPFWKDGLSEDIAVGGQTIQHLLHLYHLWNVPIVKRDMGHHRRSWLLPSYCVGRRQTKVPGSTSALPSATELYEAGITFKVNKNSPDIFDVSFKNGIIKIPTLVIDSKIMSLLANLLFWERLNREEQVKQQQRVTSYIHMMDSFINTKKDIILLQKFGVITNRLKSDEDAASFFNDLGGHSGMNVSNNFYAPLIQDMMIYYESSWHGHLTALKHNYLNSPWKIISVFAGILLLFLSCVQTYYTVFPSK